MKTWLTMFGAMSVMCTVCGAVYEAEDFADANNSRIVTDESASGGKCVELLKSKNDGQNQDSTAVQWKFTVTEQGNYDLRIRVYARNGGSDSVFVSLDGEKEKTAFFPRHQEWYELERIKVPLSPGEHTLILKTREKGLLVDKLTVTPPERYSPAALEYFAAPPVYPVRGEHPRVLLREQDVAVIRERLTHPENANIWKLVKSMADSPTIDKLDPAKHSAPCGLYSARVLREIEAKAFVWLMEGDRAMGESAVKSMLGVLASTQLKQGFPDITRQVGETIFLAGLVYDWCYPLMTPEQRAWVIVHAEELCSQMEVGFPPLRQGNVCGHACEAQISRDLFCYGIAVYDESPEMYRIAAGRLFGELTEARRFFYPSGRHHQGSSYGPGRYKWEMYAAQVVRRFCGMELYDRDAANMAYDWLYNRTPDGAVFQVGDSFLPDQPFTRFPEASFFLYTWARSPLAKAEFLLQDGMKWAKDNPVIYLVLNEPDVKPATPEELANLPLTHYFPMPLPAMTARSGWGFGKDSDPVVVEMIGAGYQFLNHHHQDAGSFQIYHRGLLAADLGQYKRYGSDYDWNFNKQSIAHNTLLIRDPRGKDGKISWPHRPTVETFDFVGGQLWPDNGNGVNNLDGLLKKGYQTGNTVAHAFGPNGKLPLYSHLKCDLSMTYGARVTRYFRSFVYVNTNDPELPAVLTVFDHVTAASPDFEKSWNLNTYLKPVIAGNTVTAVWDKMGYNGQLKAVSLLPENAVIDSVPAHTVYGKTFTPPKPELPSANAFRTEIRPQEKVATDTFLTVIGVGKAGKPLIFEAKTIPGKTIVGAAFKNYAVYFSANANLLTDTFELTVPDGKDIRIVVTDLAPGAWKVLMGDKTIAHRKVPDADGTFFFIVPQGGTVTIRPDEEPDTDYSAQKAIPASGDCGIFLDGKKVFSGPAQNIQGRAYVPVRPLVGKAFHANENGFDLDRSGIRYRFTAKDPYIQTGGYRFFVDVEPVFAAGEWMYPAETLAIIMNRRYSIGLRNMSVKFRTIPEKPGVVPVMAAYSPVGIDNLFDGDPASHWTRNGKQSVVTMFLGAEKTIGGLKLLWHNSSSRIYAFEILTSTDGKNFTQVWKGESGKTSDWETVKFAPVQAAFVRLIGYGNQVNNRTSICELELLTPEK